MKKLLICALLLVLFSCPASAGERYPDYPDIPEAEYVEGQVIVVLPAPLWSDYDPDREAYAQAVLQQAEDFARKYGLELMGDTMPTAARRIGQNIFLLHSEDKTTKELMQMLSSDPDVIEVEPNYIHEYVAPQEESGGCNVGFGRFMLLLFGFAYVGSQLKI